MSWLLCQSEMRVFTSHFSQVRCVSCSRNSENNTVKYPDIAASVPGLVKEGIKSVVLDCEAVAFERETGRILPFQVYSPLLLTVAEIRLLSLASVSLCCALAPVSAIAHASLILP